MGLSRELARVIAKTTWFNERFSPFAVLDADLTIRAVNSAFERAAVRTRGDLIGMSALEAFPDDPNDPDAGGSEKVTASVETAMRTGLRDWMDFQRYDIPDPTRPGAYLHRVWLPVNTPLLEEGRVVGVLHHAQRVPLSLGRPAQAVEGHAPMELADAFDDLGARFADLEEFVVLGMLTDSYRVVLEAVPDADVSRAAQLAEIRLAIQRLAPQLRTRSPSAGSLD